MFHQTFGSQVFNSEGFHLGAGGSDRILDFLSDGLNLLYQWLHGTKIK
jgi:hypothetical protein